MNILLIFHLFILWLEGLSGIVLTLSIFRIPIFLNRRKIAATSLVMTLVSYYIRDMMGMFDYSVFFVVVTFVTLTFLLFKLPLLYAFVVCITGYLAIVLIQMALALSGYALHITSPEQLRSVFWHDVGISVSTVLIVFAVSYWLHRKKLGFMFVAARFHGVSGMNGYNYVLTAIMLLAIVFIQLAVLSFNIKSLHFILLLGMLVLFISAIFVAYRHNKKLLREKYNKTRL